MSKNSNSNDFSRRTLLCGAAAVAGLAITPWTAQAQGNWPDGQTLKIVAPFPPGGSVDAISRLVQPGLQQKLGTTIIIENQISTWDAVVKANKISVN